MTPASEPQILIVGAGPVGLTAALALSAQGFRPRIIDKAERPARTSKALAVNPRSLALLEPLGVTEAMLAEGRRVRAANIWRGLASARLTRLEFSALPHRFNFMLALPQSRSEALLAEALAARGIEVERGTELIDFEEEPAGPQVRLSRNGTVEAVRPSLVIGADGAHSRLRSALGIGFPGGRIEREWHLVDVPLESALATDEVHLCLLGRDLLFMLSIDGRVARLVSNRAELLEQVPRGRRIGEALWRSSFRISHRLAERFGVGTAYLAGDAAHIHSPVGARGMNLGIEDACVLAGLIAEGRASDYEGLRRPVARRVVRETDAMTRLAAGLGPLRRAVRDFLGPLLLRLPRVQAGLRRRIMGLGAAAGPDA